MVSLDPGTGCHLFTQELKANLLDAYKLDVKLIEYVVLVMTIHACEVTG